MLRKESINISYVPVEKLNRLTNKNHQGVVAQISPIEFYNLEDLVINVIESGKTPLFLLLDQISDVRNFGAIIRTADKDRKQKEDARDGRKIAEHLASTSLQT